MSSDFKHVILGILLMAFALVASQCVANIKRPEVVLDYEYMRFLLELRETCLPLEQDESGTAYLPVAARDTMSMVVVHTPGKRAYYCGGGLQDANFHFIPKEHVDEIDRKFCTVCT